jgi:hypothetical protein
VKYVLAFAGLALTAYLALQPNPLRDAVTEFLEALTALVGRL